MRRSFVLLGLLLFVALCWLWIVPMARDMYGTMTGVSAWMMTPEWDAPHLFLLWLMWAVMMAAMMLPSVMPLLMLYDGVVRRRSPERLAFVKTYAMAAGYLLAWAVFSVAAVVLQRLLTRALIVSPMMEMPGNTAVGVTLLLAGAYQFTPWKNVCLSQCRSPLAFVMQRWRNGTLGALTMGLEHGAWCLGCCWALMLLLFAGGVMNLAVIIGLTAVVLTEKLLPFGAQMSRATGAGMLAGAAWLLLR